MKILSKMAVGPGNAPSAGNAGMRPATHTGDSAPLPVEYALAVIAFVGLAFLAAIVLAAL
jgi:hypothetical protein